METRKRLNLISKRLYETLDTHIEEIRKYLKSTYGEHYSGKLQTTDVWEALHTLDTTARDTAIKYLARYGRKGGRNKKDLYKAIHYIMLILEHDHPGTK